MSSASPLKFALVGNPNSGKTSVFNRFTGLNQSVGNFPGVTVDKKTGTIQLLNGSKATLIDLPGTYSLYPNSLDEKVVLEVLINKEGEDYPHAVIYIADANHLERHLLLLTQIMDLGIPCVLGLNMVDLVRDGGKIIAPDKLSKSLQIPVVEINGRTGEGLQELIAAISDINGTHVEFMSTNGELKTTLDRIREAANIDSYYYALQVAHHTDFLSFLTPEQKQAINRAKQEGHFNSIKYQVEEVLSRLNKIKPISMAAVSRKEPAGTKGDWTQRLDAVLTHKVFGSIIFLSILFLIFQSIFAWATYPMDLIDLGMARLISYLNSVLPTSFLTSLLTDGILAGLGGILIFIPQITILFMLIALLEEVGYMSRAVYLSDSVMQKFGLNGRSMVALISGVACAIPAVMSTRTISNWKERLITIFVTPFISCSARIPVFTVLIALVVPEERVFGLINLQGMVMMAMYLLGASTALISAFIFKKLLKTQERSYLMMELPVYQTPYWKNVLVTVFEKVKIFVVEAGRVILVIAVILWALASYGPPGKMAAVETEVQSELAAGMLNSAEVADELASRKIEVSYAGYFGKLIEPVIKPLGFDWKIGIALITSFAAREVFVGTMATIYSIGSSDDEKTLTQRMREERNAQGALVYTRATGFSLLIFYVFAMQCMSTLAVVKRETKSWLIPFYQMVYMTGLAYLASLITYTIMS